MPRSYEFCNCSEETSVIRHVLYYIVADYDIEKAKRQFRLGVIKGGVNPDHPSPRSARWSGLKCNQCRQSQADQDRNDNWRNDRALIPDLPCQRRR